MKPFLPSVAVVLLTVACNDNRNALPVGLRADNLMLSTSAATVTVGGTYRLSIVHTHNGQTYSGNAVWQTFNPAVAAVDNTGLVTAVAPGTTVIAATNASGAQDDGSATITVVSPGLVVTGLKWGCSTVPSVEETGTFECVAVAGLISGAPPYSPISAFDSRNGTHSFSWGGATNGTGIIGSPGSMIADGAGNFAITPVVGVKEALEGDHVFAMCPIDWAVLWDGPPPQVIPDNGPFAPIWLTYYSKLWNDIINGSPLFAPAEVCAAGEHDGGNVADPQFSVFPPMELVFTGQPTSAAAGQIVSPAVVLTLQDAQGNPVTGFLTSTSVNVALGTNPSGGRLLSNGSPVAVVTATMVNGVVTFTGFGIDQAGTGYTLTASTLGLTAISTPFNIR